MITDICEICFIYQMQSIMIHHVPQNLEQLYLNGIQTYMLDKA